MFNVSCPVLGSWNSLPSTGQKNDIAPSKAGIKCPGSTSHFSPFNCCLSVVLYLDEGDCSENVHLVFCPNKQRSFEPFVCLDFVSER